MTPGCCSEGQVGDGTVTYPIGYRVTSPWNALTPEIKRAHTANAFKNLIDKHQILTNVMRDFDGQK